MLQKTNHQRGSWSQFSNRGCCTSGRDRSAPEVEEEHVQETATPDIPNQENDGQQEDVDDEMVTLDLEMLNPSRIPSLFLSESTNGTFLGVPSEAAGPSVSQQATTARRQRSVEGRADAETQASEIIGHLVGMSGENVQQSRLLLAAYGGLKVALGGIKR